MYCPQCGKPTLNSAKFCSICGALLSSVDYATPEKHQTEADRLIPIEYYQALVGPKNQNYYVAKFLRYDSDGRARASWNWTACFLTFYWVLYRKMWLIAAGYLIWVIFLKLGLPILMSEAVGHSDAAAVAAMVAWILADIVGIAILPALYANALYYKHCRKKIARARSRWQDKDRQLVELTRMGGTLPAAPVVAIFAVIAIGVLAAIAIPAYQDYIARAKVSKALSMGDAAAESVAEFYYQHQYVPTSLQESGFAESLPSSVRQVGLGPNGEIIITMANAPIEGKRLLLLPSLDQNSRIVWECKGDEMSDNYLPTRCRGNR